MYETDLKKNVIYIEWDCIDNYTFDVYITKTEKGIFNYLKRKRRLLVSIPYVKNKDGCIVDYLEVIQPLVLKYAEDYNADVIWEHYLDELVKTINKKRGND